MRYVTFLCFAMLLQPASYAQAQLWSAVLDSDRAMDWSTVGVQGGIPERATICDTLGTAGQVSTFAQSVIKGL